MPAKNTTTKKNKLKPPVVVKTYTSAELLSAFKKTESKAQNTADTSTRVSPIK